MDFDNSWDAVFRPGLATVFFSDPPAPLRLDGTGFRPDDAWWLAEMSRLIYRMQSDETGIPDHGRTRDDILRDVGFAEVAFANARGSQAAVIVPLASDADYVIVSFRGSDDIQAWLEFNAALTLTPWPGGGKVHAGFKAAFDHVWPELAPHLPAGRQRMYTGHSLGGALAVLAASVSRPAGAYTFGAPRVGDATFAATIDDGLVYRVVNHTDIVPDLLLGLSHAGRLYYIGHDGVIEPSPSSVAVFTDRFRSDPSFDLHRLMRTRAATAPQPLADHAPLNYVAHLAHAARAAARTFGSRRI